MLPSIKYILKENLPYILIYRRGFTVDIQSEKYEVTGDLV